MNKKSDTPIFYNPKALGLISQGLSYTSYIVLFGYILFFVINILTKFLPPYQPSNWDNYYYLGYFQPIYLRSAKFVLDGFTTFLMMQGIAMGINVLMEIDINSRTESDDVNEGFENE